MHPPEFNKIGGHFCMLYTLKNIRARITTWREKIDWLKHHTEQVSTIAKRFPNSEEMQRQKENVLNFTIQKKP